MECIIITKVLIKSAVRLVIPKARQLREAEKRMLSELLGALQAKWSIRTSNTSNASKISRLHASAEHEASEASEARAVAEAACSAASVASVVASAQANAAETWRAW